MTFLFIATIGPVQPFIASARRTRDLYVGSTLLSELSKTAANAIAREEGIAHLIFPTPADEGELEPGTSFNVANKIVAIVDRDPQQVTELGKVVREAINQRLTSIRDEAFHSIQFADEDKAKKQIDNLVEYSWVAVPFGTKETPTYEAARERAEATLFARKNTHTFGPVTWGSEQAKSSIDGKLECVIPKDLYQGKEGQAKKLYTWYKAGPHERLSAVDLLKRLAANQLLKTNGTPTHIVLSTSHIAATPFLQRLNRMTQDEQERAKEAWKKYLQQVDRLVPSHRQDEPTSPLLERLPSVHSETNLPENYLTNEVIGTCDGAMLFEERLLDDMVTQERKENKAFKDAQAALKQFFKTVGMHPSPYYALLLADGDGMGKAIEAHAKGEHGAEHHRNLSKALSRFSEDVEAIVQRHYGSLVYAGGDDVMALLPLDAVLECAHELAKKFKEELHTFSYQEKDKEGKEITKWPTLSAGIAVVHHVSLLDEALALARSAEHRAKDQPGKNALAITIRKRSGEDYPLTVGWDNDTQSSQHSMLYEQLREIIALYEGGFIPKGAAYELRDMVQRLQPARGDLEAEQLQKIIQIDAARILRRKLLLPERSDERKEVEKKFADLLKMIGVEKDVNRAFMFEQKVDMTQFINALIVAQVFAEEAGERKGKDQLDG
ncbi:MAG: type III-B CRISPR-associated protein Cas10/Cmr2 [Ktedonobacteraceae bacterium]|nr:type III-B CRISPR-associated protein Cas10/Cmr2 [Ktedonobacteraceae bacterium]